MAMTYRRSATYIFFKGHGRLPSYQILSCGELWKFNGTFTGSCDEVAISAAEVRELLEPNSKRAIWQKCEELYTRRKKEDFTGDFISEERKSELELLMEKKRASLC